MGVKAIDPLIRFFRYVEKQEDGCWNWTGSKVGRTNYGKFTPSTGKTIRVHRFSYEKHVGPIPEGLTIDHLCKNSLCVNPDHMEPVSQAENSRRADKWKLSITHCPQGHEYNSENTRITKLGHRICRSCHRVEAGLRYHRNKKLGDEPKRKGATAE